LICTDDQRTDVPPTVAGKTASTFSCLL